MPGGRIDGEGQDLLRRLRGHLLDVHAAFGRADEGDTGSAAVDEKREVKLARDVGAVLDVDAVDLLARRPGLVGDERAAEHLLGHRRSLLDRFREADTALFPRFGFLELALAAAARVDLRLDDPEGPVKLARRGLGLFGPEHDAAVGDRRAVGAQESLGLVFVDVHR